MNFVLYVLKRKFGCFFSILSRLIYHPLRLHYGFSFCPVNYPQTLSLNRALDLETVLPSTATQSGIHTSRRNTTPVATGNNTRPVKHSSKILSTTAANSKKERTVRTTVEPHHSSKNHHVPEVHTTPASEDMTNEDSDSKEPILTMFTTFKNSQPKTHIYKNTIRNWERLKPWVQPVLYYLPGEDSLLDFAKAHGWDVLEVPKLSKAKVPILRHMFLKTREKYTTPFYCYTNGDILFDDGLIKTLKVLKPVTSKMKQVLIVGRRTNYKVSPGQVIDSFDDIKASSKKGQLFGTNAQDYFISTSRGYPWETIPDFVVGRVGYDNWLVVTAIVKKMVVIDTTKTIIALHQTGIDGNFAGKKNYSLCRLCVTLMTQPFVTVVANSLNIFVKNKQAF